MPWIKDSLIGRPQFARLKDCTCGWVLGHQRGLCLIVNFVGWCRIFLVGWIFSSPRRWWRTIRNPALPCCQSLSRGFKSFNFCNKMLQMFYQLEVAFALFILVGGQIWKTRTLTTWTNWQKSTSVAAPLFIPRAICLSTHTHTHPNKPLLTPVHCVYSTKAPFIEVNTVFLFFLTISFLKMLQVN